MDRNDEIFKGTSFADLMHDVYHNSKKKDRQIKMLITQLQGLLKSPSEATIIVPLIKEYLDIGVKNDDHLVKLAAIVQRYISATQTVTNDGGLLSESEKADLLSKYGDDLEVELNEELKEVDKNDVKLQENIKEAKKKLDEE